MQYIYGTVRKFPDVMLIANRGSYLAENKQTTHFSSTRVIDIDFRKPRYDLFNKAVGIKPHLIYKKLKPVLFHSAETARNLAIEEYSNSEKERCLKLLHRLSKSIDRLDSEVVELIRASDKKKKQVKKIEFKLISLGVSAEEVKIATRHKELPYMLTEEVEREVIREEMKRKRKEEERKKHGKNKDVR